MISRLPLLQKELRASGQLLVDLPPAFMQGARGRKRFQRSSRDAMRRKRGLLLVSRPLRRFALLGGALRRVASELDAELLLLPTYTVSHEAEISFFLFDRDGCLVDAI